MEIAKDLDRYTESCSSLVILQFGYLKDLGEVLDSHEIPIMSIMSVPKSEKGDWFLILRVQAKDAEVAAGDLKKKGFKVVDVT